MGFDLTCSTPETDENREIPHLHVRNRKKDLKWGYFAVPRISKLSYTNSRCFVCQYNRDIAGTSRRGCNFTKSLRDWGGLKHARKNVLKVMT